MTPSPPEPGSTRAARTTEVFADLRMETGGHRAHLVGDGSSLVLHLDQPLAMAASLRRVSLPEAAGVAQQSRGLGRMATVLDTAGFTVDVRGPDGDLLVRLGRGQGSRLGRLLTGSRAVRFGSARELTGTLTDALPTGRILVGACAVVIATAAAIAVRRARSG
jgi:hypothetical protein